MCFKEGATLVSTHTNDHGHPLVFGFGKLSKFPTSLGFWFRVSFKAFNIPWFLVFGKFQRSQSSLILGFKCFKGHNLFLFYGKLF